MYAGTPKHPIFSGSTFGLMSGEKPLFQPQVQGGHEALGSVLNQMGLRYEETSGRYNEPERSYIIHNPTLDQMKQLGKMFGQESVIHSSNGQHQFHYTNGENEGKYHVAEHQNPIEHFEQPPPDAYTKLPGHGYFRINFNWGQTHGGELAKAWPQPIKPEDQGGMKAGSNSGPQDYLTHATAPGQNRRQTQINPVVHDELIGSMSGGNEAGGVVDSAGVKTVEHRPNPDQVHFSSRQQLGEAQPTADAWAANDAQNALIPHRQETWADATDTLGGDFQTEVNHNLAPFPSDPVSLGGVNWAFEHRPYTKFGGAVVAATGASRGDGRSFHLFHVDPSGRITGYDPGSDTVGNPLHPTTAPLVQYLQNHFAGKLDYFKSETEELFERLIKAKLSKAKPPQIPYETQVAMDGLQEQGFGLGEVPQSAGPVGIVSERAARANKMTPAGGYANLNSPAITEVGPTQHAENLAAKFGIQNPDAARNIFWDDAVNAHVSRDPDDPNYRQYAHYPTMPGVMAADDLGPELERHHFNDQSNPNEPPASTLSMVPPKEVMDLAWKASPAHPHSYDWHDGHTDHHEQDLGGPRLPGLIKSDSKPKEVGEDLNEHEARKLAEWWNANHEARHEVRPHDNKAPAGGKKRFKVVRLTKADNDQAAGVGVSTYKQFALPYGQVTPGQNTNLLHYPYHGKLAEIEKLVANHGYKTYYAGGKYGKPDLANKNYNTGHLMVYDPTPASGGDFGEEEYTKGWRQIHELAHALTYPELNKIYGEGRRIGKLGHHRTMNEALRAVHWEWLAGHKQRELSEQIGIKIPDETFHKELNTVMHDAAHRAVTGKFTEPSQEGFVPHGRKVPLHTALQLVRDSGHQMGLTGLHETLKKPLAKTLPKGAKLPKKGSKAIGDQTENRANAAAGPIAEDSLLDHGFQREVKEGHQPISTDGVAPSALEGGWNACRACGSDFEMAHPADLLCPDCNHQNTLSPAELEPEWIVQRPPDEPAIPWSPYGDTSTDTLSEVMYGVEPSEDTREIESKYWKPVARDSTRISRAAHSAEHASPASRIPAAPEMKQAMKSSPKIMEMIRAQQKLGKSELKKTLPKGAKLPRPGDPDIGDQTENVENAGNRYAVEDSLLGAGFERENLPPWEHNTAFMTAAAGGPPRWIENKVAAFQDPNHIKGAKNQFWRRKIHAPLTEQQKASTAANIPSKNEMQQAAQDLTRRNGAQPESPIFRATRNMRYGLGQRNVIKSELKKAKPPHPTNLVTADQLQEQGFKPTPGYTTKQGLGTRLNAVRPDDRQGKPVETEGSLPIRGPRYDISGQRYITPESIPNFIDNVAVDGAPLTAQAISDAYHANLHSDIGRYSSAAVSEPADPEHTRWGDKLPNRVNTDKLQEKAYWDEIKRQSVPGITNTPWRDKSIQPGIPTPNREYAKKSPTLAAIRAAALQARKEEAETWGRDMTPDYLKSELNKSLQSPAAAGVTRAPQLHNTVEGFMNGLKALPKGTADRGRFITSHMSHPDFLGALQKHPQGKQIHAMLTNHLNSVQNAGLGAGTKTVAKSEPLGNFNMDFGGAADEGVEYGRAILNRMDQGAKFVGGKMTHSLASIHARINARGARQTKKSELAKALPRGAKLAPRGSSDVGDQTENEANARGFLNQVPAQDAAMESGAKLKPQKRQATKLPNIPAGEPMLSEYMHSADQARGYQGLKDPQGGIPDFEAPDTDDYSVENYQAKARKIASQIAAKRPLGDPAGDALRQHGLSVVGPRTPDEVGMEPFEAPTDGPHYVWPEDDEHPDYPRSDWEYEVANGDTRRDYSAWVAAQEEAATHFSGDPASDHLDHLGNPAAPEPFDDINHGNPVQPVRGTASDKAAANSFWGNVGINALGKSLKQIHQNLHKTWPQPIKPEDKGGTAPSKDPNAEAAHLVFQDRVAEYNGGKQVKPNLAAAGYLRPDGRPVAPHSTTASVAQGIHDEGIKSAYDVASRGGTLPLDRVPTVDEANLSGVPTNIGSRRTINQDEVRDYLENALPEDAEELGGRIGYELDDWKHRRIGHLGLDAYSQGVEAGADEIARWQELSQELGLRPDVVAKSPILKRAKRAKKSEDLTKGDVIKFPGNKAPPTQQPKPASVTSLPQKPLAVPKSWTEAVQETIRSGADRAKPELEKAWPQPIKPKDKGGTVSSKDPAAGDFNAVTQDMLLEGHPNISQRPNKRPVPLNAPRTGKDRLRPHSDGAMDAVDDNEIHNDNLGLDRQYEDLDHGEFQNEVDEHALPLKPKGGGMISFAHYFVPEGEIRMLSNPDRLNEFGGGEHTEIGPGRYIQGSDGSLHRFDPTTNRVLKVWGTDHTAHLRRQFKPEIPIVAKKQS